MDYTQFYIIQNLRDYFETLRFKEKIDGMLIIEGALISTKKKSGSSLCFFTLKQIESASDGIKPIPEFGIEIISNSDKYKHLNEKMQYYRAGKAKLLWHIYPMTKEVHVFFGNNLDTGYIKSGDEICSADPVLPDFQMSVNDIFKRKKA